MVKIPDEPPFTNQEFKLKDGQWVVAYIDRADIDSRESLSDWYSSQKGFRNSHLQTVLEREGSRKSALRTLNSGLVYRVFRDCLRTVGAVRTFYPIGCPAIVGRDDRCVHYDEVSYPRQTRLLSDGARILGRISR